MVDFNNDATVTTPSWELLKILALEKRENLLLGLEAYYKDVEHQVNADHEQAIVKVRLRVLFLEVYGWYVRASQQDGRLPEPGQVWSKIESKVWKDNLDVCLFLLQWLDQVNLTRIDTKRVYDKLNAEVENEYNQL